MGAELSNPADFPDFLDKLSPVSAFALWFRGRNREIFALEPIPSSAKWLSRMLLFRGIKVRESKFFVGDMRTLSGEGILFASSKIACDVALASARRLVKEHLLLKTLNERYQGDVVLLYIAKQLNLQVIYWTLRCLVAQRLSGRQNAELLIARPDHFAPEDLAAQFPEMRIEFYGGGWPGRLYGLMRVTLAGLKKVLFKPLLARLSVVLPRPSATVADGPAVLMFQESTNIRADRRLRAQPHHWLESGSSPKDYSVFLVETQSFGLPIASSDKEWLAKDGIVTLPPEMAHRLSLNCTPPVLAAALRSDRRDLLLGIFRSLSFMKRYWMLQLYFFLKEAESMASLVVSLNAKVFVNREPQFSYADALQLVAPTLGLKTVAYQYSNLGFRSLIMMSSADVFVTFSDMYREIYCAGDLRPGRFVQAGYIYNGVGSHVRDSAKRHRGELAKVGAEYVICYFDESVQANRWGLISRADHRKEMRALAQAVVSDPSIGVILKTQYLRNSPSRLYPEDELIAEAVTSGRFIELMDGFHRNEIYPMEAALASDLCISHKFGATAGLEAAVAGVRTVLLDTSGCVTCWDPIYAQAKVEFESIDTILAAVAEFRTGAPAASGLGNWDSIIHYFDPYRDGKAHERLRNLIEAELAKA
jgi:hypothetical protein